MDYYTKFLTLEKFILKHIANDDLKNTKITCISMKNIHGKIIQTMYEVMQHDDDNKLEVLSDLQVTSDKMILIINKIDSLITEKFPEKQQIHEVAIVPETHDRASVDVVLNKDAPSLVLFFADWCGPCKAFLPMWTDLEKSNKSKKLNMAKFSCVKYDNECKKITAIKAYPTIVLVKPGSDKLIVFNEMRNVHNIVAFVKENTGVDMTAQ